MKMSTFERKYSPGVISSQDMYWENKMDKRKRSLQTDNRQVDPPAQFTPSYFEKGNFFNLHNHQGFISENSSNSL